MVPTPAPETRRACLEIRGGKSADIETNRNCHQMVFKYSQRYLRSRSDLIVYRVPSIEDKSVHLAFCFELNGEKYFPAVQKDSTTKKISFKIEAQNEPDISCKRFLFKWDNNGEYGSLSSVAEPERFLHVHRNMITLSPNPDLGFRVKFLDAISFSMMHVQNSCIKEGHKVHVRHPVQRKAVQWGATRGRQKTSEKKKSRV